MSQILHTIPSIPILSILNISGGGFASPSLLKLALLLKVENLNI